MQAADIQRVCVYCGAHAGTRPEYLDAARRFGAALGARGLGLVYGGASVGLMGALADAALAAGAPVVGIMPRTLVDRELAHRGLTEAHVVDDMHTRKAMMLARADACVALPGGAGTLDELFEAWTWLQLGLHTKPVALLDVAGVWRPLVGLLDHLVAEGFVRAVDRAALIVEPDADALLDRLAAFVPPPGRWSAPR